MKIITVTNQKGGTGKTSITMNLGVALALTGKKILLEEKRPATIDFKAREAMLPINTVLAEVPSN